MNDKERAMLAMRDLGHNASVIGGVVMIAVSAEDYKDPKVHKKIMSDFKTIGYRESRGVMIESRQAV